MDDTNFNRYVLVDEQDLGLAKVDVVVRSLRGSGLTVMPRPETIDEVVSAVSAGQIPRPTIVLSAVDNNIARRSLQLLWPDLLIQGATGDLVSRVSRHEYGSEYLTTFFDIDSGMPLDRALMQAARPRSTCYCTVRADSIRRYREHVRGRCHG